MRSKLARYYYSALKIVQNLIMKYYLTLVTKIVATCSEKIVLDSPKDSSKDWLLWLYPANFMTLMIIQYWDKGLNLITFINLSFGNFVAMVTARVHNI